MDAMPPPLPLDVPRKKSPLPKVSLILGILGIFPLGPLGSIPAIICGHMSLSRDRAAGIPAGGPALAGVATGYLGVGIQILLAVVWLTTSPAAGRLLSAVRNPISYEFVIEPHLEGVPSANVAIERSDLQAVLSRRLQRAKVPYRFVPQSGKRLKLQVGRPHAIPLPELRALIVSTAAAPGRLPLLRRTTRPAAHEIPTPTSHSALRS